MSELVLTVGSCHDGCRHEANAADALATWDKVLSMVAGGQPAR